MNKLTRTVEFLKRVFEQDELARQAAAIVQALLVARSPRLSDIAQQMPGTEAANYKSIQRFLRRVDLRGVLWRLFQTEAPFVIGDPTEIPRRQARHTEYVGTLSDGKTRGFWLLLLATPFRGRAIPCGFVTYSSKTIGDTATSRNMYHWEAFDQIKPLLGRRPLVLDREFSYLEQLEYCVHAGVNFVIRLNLGSRPPRFLDATGRRVEPVVSLGEHVIHHQLLYKDRVAVNLVGTWDKGSSEPLWVMSNLDPLQAYEIYKARMKIEESFRDLKSLLSLDRLMNKSQSNMEQMAALTMLAYTIGVLVGEAVRDELYGPAPAQNSGSTGSPEPLEPHKKWYRYSGLFMLLRRKVQLSNRRWSQLLARVLLAFDALVAPPVRTHV